MEFVESLTPPGSPTLSPMPFTEFPKAQPSRPTELELAALFDEYPPSPEHETITNFTSSYDDAKEACESSCEPSDAQHVCLRNLMRDSKVAIDMLQHLIDDQRNRFLALAKQHVRRDRLFKHQESKLYELTELVEEGPNSQMRDQAAEVLKLKKKLRKGEVTISTIVAENNADKRAAECKQELAEAEIAALKTELSFTKERLAASQKQNRGLVNAIRAGLNPDTASTAITASADNAYRDWLKMRARLMEQQGVELQVVAYRHELVAQTQRHEKCVEDLTRETIALRNSSESTQWKLDLIEDAHAAVLAEKDTALATVRGENATLRSTIDAQIAATDVANAGDWAWTPLRQRFDAVHAEIEPLRERIQELEKREEHATDWEAWELRDWKKSDPMIVARGRGYASLVHTLQTEREARAVEDEAWEKESAEVWARVHELEGRVRELGGRVEGDEEGRERGGEDNGEDGEEGEGDGGNDLELDWGVGVSGNVMGNGVTQNGKAVDREVRNGEMGGGERGNGEAVNGETRNGKPRNGETAGW